MLQKLELWGQTFWRCGPRFLVLKIVLDTATRPQSEIDGKYLGPHSNLHGVTPSQGSHPNGLELSALLKEFVWFPR